MTVSKHKPIQVFEYQKLFIDDAGDFKTKHWRALASYNEKYKSKYFTVLHNGIRFSNYVGVIQAGNLTIEILPKIDGENIDSEETKNKWHKVLLQMLKECSIIKIDHVEKANLKLKANSILDIYIELFLNEVESLLHKGLIKKYRKQSENIPALKGKIEFSKHISTNIIHKEKFFVQHIVYDKQNKYNQILNEALQIIPSLITNTLLIDKLGRITLDYHELESFKITEEIFQNIQYDRKNSHYKEAIEIARMLLLNYRPDITGGANNVIAILFDMNKLWEEYIFRKLQRASKNNVKVSKQQSKNFWKPSNSVYSKSIRPDIVITKGDEIFIIDTKWKLNPVLSPASDDLKQMFVYNLYWKCCHSFLLYPSSNDQNVTGAYHKFIQQTTEINNCSIATCSILDDNHLLDKNIGVRIFDALIPFERKK